MEIFWNTIAAYNTATWPAQIAITVVSAVLLVLLYRKPTHTVHTVMKILMAFLNFWIAGIYYMVYCRPREYHSMLALFWTIMGGMWIYDLTVKRTPLERSGKRNALAIPFFCLPLLYPVFSLALGRTFPVMTMPVMPCSVAVFTIGLMLAFSERINIVLAMFLCHWALIGLSKIYFFGIPEDYLLACATVPALYILFKKHIEANAERPSKPSPRILRIFLVALCATVGVAFAITLMYQFDLFTEI